MAEPHLHESHPEVVKRLKRAAGHLQGVVEMIEAAIANAKRTLIHDHLEHCLDRVVGAVPRAERGPIDEFKAITKYL